MPREGEPSLPNLKEVAGGGGLRAAATGPAAAETGAGTARDD